MDIMTRSITLLALAIVLGLGGCAKKEDPPTAASRATRPIIGLSVLTLTNPFFKVIADTITEAAGQHGYTVSVVSGEFDIAKQQNQVKDFIVQGVSAIVLTPCDSKAIGPAIQEANDAGIPVFTADIACLAAGVKIVSHIATDNYQGGRLAAAAMIEALGGKGRVAIIDFPEVESVLLRTQGFEAALAEAREKGEADIQIVTKLPGGGVKNLGFRAAEDILQAHPEIDGIFAINDPSALGAVAALENAGKTDQVRVIGFDGQPEGKQAIRDGAIYADPIQFPDKIGRETVRVIVEYFRGGDVPPQILIPTSLYRRADAEQDASLTK
jgi:ribose transport system substrate-binding protein